MSSGQHHQRTRSASVAPTVMLTHTASRFLFDERGRQQIKNSEWETIYPSVATAARALKMHVVRRLYQVCETRKQLQARKKPPRHWSELAPHSASSVLASQIVHLNHLEALLTGVVAACRVLADEHPNGTGAVGSSPSVAGARDDASQSLLTSATSDGNGSMPAAVFLPRGASSAEAIASSLSNVMLTLFASNPVLVSKLRQVVSTEEDLRRREAFARLSEWQQGGDATTGMDAGAMASMRNFSPLRQGRAAKQQASLQLFVRDISDATSFIGRRICSVRGAVDAWLWEGFDGEAVAERLSNFVDEVVGEVRDAERVSHSNIRSAEAANRRASVTGAPLDSLEGVPDEILIAAVEDELYCYDSMHRVLLESLKEEDDDEVLDSQIRALRGASQESLHVPEMFRCPEVSPDGTPILVVPFAKAIATLRTIQLYRTPTRKLLVIKAASKQLLEEMKVAAVANGAREDKLIVGGDDFIPMFVYVTVKSGLPRLASEVLFLRHCMPRSLRHGELGYYSTTLEFACEFIKNMACAAHAPPPSLSARSVVSEATPDEYLAEQGGRVQHLAIIDVPFAEQWVKSGVVLFYGDSCEAARDALLCPGGVAVNEGLLAQRYRLLAVASVSTGEDASTSSNSGDCEVEVVLLDISSLSDIQWTFACETTLGGAYVSTTEATTSNGVRVLVPTVRRLSEGGGGGWARACSAPITDAKTWVRHRTEVARCNNLRLPIVTAAQSAMERDQWEESWPLALPSCSVASAERPNIFRLQQLLCLFGSFSVSDVDGSCCRETCRCMESMHNRFKQRGMVPQQRGSSHDVAPVDQSSQGAVVEVLSVAFRTLMLSIQYLQQNCFIPVPSASASGEAPQLQLSEVVSAIRRFQEQKQLMVTGKLDDVTVPHLLGGNVQLR